MALSDFAPAGRPPEIEVVTSVSQAVSVFDRVVSQDDTFRVFRGHAKYDWPIAPSIFREDVDTISHEYKLIRDLIALYPRDFENDDTMFDRLVRMQHFGLRTRLLDVSRNPLAALYFAVEDGVQNGTDGAVLVISVPDERIKYYDSDSVSCIANLANLSNQEKEAIEETPARSASELHKINAVDRLFQFIKAEKPEFRARISREDLFKPYFVHPKMDNKRIIAQNGAFIIYGLKRTKGPTFKKNIGVRSIKIPASAKDDIRKTLRRLGYDDSTIYPDIERSARQLIKRYVP